MEAPMPPEALHTSRSVQRKEQCLREQLLHSTPSAKKHDLLLCFGLEVVNAKKYDLLPLLWPRYGAPVLRVRRLLRSFPWMTFNTRRAAVGRESWLSHGNLHGQESSLVPNTLNRRRRALFKFWYQTPNPKLAPTKFS